jgi:hypothetical protein
MNQLSAAMNGFSMGGPKISTNIQAVYTLSICASKEQIHKLAALHDTSRYLQACLYTHAKTQTDIPWIQEEFEKDVRQTMNGLGSNIQFSSYAIGVALRKEEGRILPGAEEGKIVQKLCQVVRSGRLTSEELTCCLLAIGWICDQRTQPAQITPDIIEEALSAVTNVDVYYADLVAAKQEKAKEVAGKMINGDILNVDEEQFLLTKLER